MTGRAMTPNQLWQSMIEAALHLVDERNSMTKASSTAQWFADRTIKINLGHKSGQTNFICKYASEFDLILVDSAQQANRLRRTQNPRADVLPVYELLDSLLASHLPQYSRIWFDNPTDLTQEQLARVYNKTRNPTTRWIVLGGNNV